MSYLSTLVFGTVFDSVQNYGVNGRTRLGITTPPAEGSRTRESL